MNVRLDLYRSQTRKTTFFVLSKSQLDSPSHFTSNLSPEAVENLKQELSSTKVTLHLDYNTSSLSFFLVRRAKHARHANDLARDWRHETLFFILGLPPSSTLSRGFPPLTKPDEKTETARRLHFTYFGVLWKCFSLQPQNQKSCFFCQ